MKEVYFDTNIYSHIYKRQHGITDTDIERLVKAIREDRIRILTSVTVLEETICSVLSAPPKETIGRLKLIRQLAKRKKIIQAHTDFRDDLYCYSRGEAVHGSFISPPLKFKEVLTEPDSFDIVKAAKESMASIEKYHASMKATFKTHIEPQAEPIRQQRLQPCFDDYWNVEAIHYVEELAKQGGVLDECRKRGLAGLLAVRSIHIATFGQLSLLYANIYEGRVTKRSDSRDMHHVLLSSATDAFITDDSNLLRILSRKPICNYEVMNINTFLERIR